MIGALEFRGAAPKKEKGSTVARAAFSAKK
jgi:hypothetical protein